MNSTARTAHHAHNITRWHWSDHFSTHSIKEMCIACIKASETETTSQNNNLYMWKCIRSKSEIDIHIEMINVFGIFNGKWSANWMKCVYELRCAFVGSFICMLFWKCMLNAHHVNFCAGAKITIRIYPSCSFRLKYIYLRWKLWAWVDANRPPCSKQLSFMWSFFPEAMTNLASHEFRTKLIFRCGIAYYYH